MKQKELSRWLKAILVLAVVAGLVTLLVLVPSFGRSTVLTYPEYAFLYWPCLLFIWLSGVPLFAAIGYAWRVCSELARDNSFTAENARRVKRISQLALLECPLYLLGAVLLMCWNALHPGVLILIFGIMFLCAAVSAAFAAMSHFIGKGAALKSENDLTV